MNLKNNLYTLPLGLGISCKACLLCLNIFSGNLFFDILIIGALRFAYLWARLLEKSVKALYSELKGSWFKPQPCYQASSDLGLK